MALWLMAIIMRLMPPMCSQLQQRGCSSPLWLLCLIRLFN